ncbi:RNA replicase component [Hoya necrotic spot virus]|nr:RNA replicase component [Hoya necrotic spot virus]
MAHITNTFNTKVAEAGLSKNTLINDLVQRKLYDSAVEELNARGRRPKVNFSKVVTQEQTLLASNAYPEFEITFYNIQNAAHSLAGGLRALELEYLMTLVPYGSHTYDIGGNFAAHLFKGRDYVHCCMPNLDIRDVARHTAQQDSVECYLAKFNRSGKPIPPFQRSSFERYHEQPDAVHCGSPFQQCPHPAHTEGKNYAIALHSLYDIPADSFGAALLRKDIHMCYAAFHFSESLLLENNYCELPEIEASFVKDGDKLSFFFLKESTLNYEHSYKNVLKYVCKTFFLASNRFVYHKEFLVTRVNTWFCKFTKVDTYVLFRGVFHKGTDCEQFYEAMEDAWENKKTLAMLNTERTILKDTSSVNYWFPKVREMVIIPLFHASIVSKKMTRSEVMVNKDFVYTVLNHIKTYQAKTLTYNNVLSFVESIRSRVIINGVTARSEWDVDKAILQPLAMTFFLQTKLSQVQDEIVLKKFQKFDHTAAELVWEKLSDAFGSLFPTIKEQLVNRGFVKVSEQALEIKVPNLYETFQDRFITEYKKSEEMPGINLSKPLEDSEKRWRALQELTFFAEDELFDINQFFLLCSEKKVDPEAAAVVIKALMSKELSLPFFKANPENLSDALSPLPVDLNKRFEDLKGTPSSGPMGVYSPDSDADAILRLANSLSTKTITPHNKDFLASCSLHGKPLTFDNNEVSTMEEFHMTSVDSLKKGNMRAMIYTGSLKVQQMKNYFDYLSASISATVSNLCKALKDTYGTATDVMEKTGVFDARNSVWIVKPKEKDHSWGVVETVDRRFFVARLKWAADKIVCEQTWLKVAVCTDTLIYSDFGKLRTLKASLRDGEPVPSNAKVTLVDGVPGCGKTKEILERCDFTKDLILVAGKEASKMIRRRANASGANLATKENVRTVDSFLMNPVRKTYSTLFIDEGLMLHTGCVNFLVALSLCDKAYVYGDTKQIPFINRIANFPYPPHFASLCYDEKEDRRTTLRCPADVTNFLNSKYDGAVVTSSSVLRSVDCKVVNGKGVFNVKSEPLHGKIITFTQSDKFDLLEKGYKDVNTVHEIQGETYDDVSLVRLTATPLELVSRDSPHVLVALTRHTKKFMYYTVVTDPMVKIVSDLSKLSNYILDMYSVSSAPK